MKFLVPIYVEERRHPTAAGTVFAVRPLFFATPTRQGENLNRVLTRLAGDIHRHLQSLAAHLRHDQLAEWSYCPSLEEVHLEVTIHLKRSTQSGRFLFVTLGALERKLAFTPSLPDLWFEVRHGNDLAEQAVQVLAKHFQARHKADELSPSLAELAPAGQSRISYLEFDIQPSYRLPEPPQIRFALGEEQEVLSGRDELQRTGRCLNWLYPDDLTRAHLREAELAKLSGWLEEPGRRPILLLGPSKAGKTALIHEYVYRLVQQKGRQFGGASQVWLLSPQRLIAGMSYVGQWENRLLAILKHAAQRLHILYFDDVLGLFSAGISAQSNLNMAHVLKPYLEKRVFRILAEMTPAAFRVLQERDRRFADLFHVLPLPEPGDSLNRRILLSTQHLLEDKYQCRFHLEALPAVMELQSRYAAEQAYPGKGAEFLRELAIKHPQSDINRQNVLAKFQEKSGLSAVFLDQYQVLRREDILAALQKRVIGQTEAIAALADLIVMAKARLNDPGRPLGSVLFLGPTGVGKTQCAKAAAEFLFGDPARFLRFDMNEYGEAAAVSRLVGAFAQPEGLLTSAVRRQPFSLVLLDEIEKAHPDVFDLLLAVLGEGRLTDALGRTASFTNCLIILTSNLGSREARSRLGFGATSGELSAVFSEAAEKFFRPEFYNRLDRIIPFHPLERGHLEQIVDQLLEEIFQREGFAQRHCILRVHPEARQWLVTQGCHPHLGARALKRALEQHLIQPIARRLAELQARQPTLIQISRHQSGLAVGTQGLNHAQFQARAIFDLCQSSPQSIAARLEQLLDRVDNELNRLCPAGLFSLKDLQSGQLRYLAGRERWNRLRPSLDELQATLAQPGESSVTAHSGKAPASPFPKKYSRINPWSQRVSPFLKDYLSSLDLREFFNEQDDPVITNESERCQLWMDLVMEGAVLSLTVSPESDGDDRVFIWLDAAGGAFKNPLDCQLLCSLYHDAIISLEGYEAKEVEGENGMLVEGPGARTLLRSEGGCLLCHSLFDYLILVRVEIIPLKQGLDIKTVLAQNKLDRENRLGQAGQAASWPDIIRILDLKKGPVVDLRSGLAARQKKTPPAEFRRMILYSAPLPPELQL